MDEISIEEVQPSSAGLKYLPHRQPVNIEFQDLVYSVPDFTGSKVILRSVSGKFRSGQLTAILGPSGAGKSTLLNVLAGYKSWDATGSVLVNGQQRNMKQFRKMTRYIMQQDIYQPMLTVREAMMISADLKLGNDLTLLQKTEVIDEILDLLRLTKAADTMGDRLSGGEKKRLSIALELVNNPPVIFLDEPTTGLDDLASSQCIALLRRVAQGGRTIVCSVHTPSAKIFEMFHHVYIVANGQCVFQGDGSNIVSYMKTVGLNCPVTYNPADFIVEVCSGEYGFEYLDRMVSCSDNGRCRNWTPLLAVDSLINGHHSNEVEEMEQEIDPKQLKQRSSGWLQFKILHRRMLKQMWRDSNYMKLRIYMTLFLGLVVGGIYQGVGHDASKALFNFGFFFTIAIAFMYNPMMPILLQFPQEVQLLKREHFNRWYRIGPYYWALIVSKLPTQIILAIVYITMVYLISNQPLELHRMAMFYSISILIALTSESLGTLIASRLSLINGMFIGPVLTVPLMLLAVYGIGYGKEVYIPPYIKLLMSLSYLRHGLEGLIAAMYGYDRADTICPDNEMYCLFSKAEYLTSTLGFEETSWPFSMVALAAYYVFFTFGAYYMIKRRLSTHTSSNMAVQYLGRFVKNHLNFSAYKY